MTTNPEAFAAVCLAIITFVFGCTHPLSTSSTPGLAVIRPNTPEDEALAIMRRRPLVAPPVGPGDPCPVTVIHGHQPGPGAGPLHPQVIPPRRALSEFGKIGGWYGTKVYWVVSPDYPGPALIRGRQLDGTQEVRFGEVAQPARELVFSSTLTEHPDGLPDGWRALPSETLVRVPGCFAWQVDGLDFQEIVVFKVDP